MAAGLVYRINNKKGVKTRKTTSIQTASWFYADGAFKITVGDTTNVHRTAACKWSSKDQAELIFKVRTTWYCRVHWWYSRIQAPSDCQCLYVNRKGFHLVSVGIVCDSDMAWVDLVAWWPGSTRNQSVLRNQALETGSEWWRPTWSGG